MSRFLLNVELCSRVSRNGQSRALQLPTFSPVRLRLMEFTKADCLTRNE